MGGSLAFSRFFVYFFEGFSMLKVGVKFCTILYRCLLVTFFCFSMISFAEEDEAKEPEAAEGEGGEEVAEQQAIYLPMKPAFIVNYGGAGRLRYLKVELSIRLANIDAANAVRYHSPFVRNNLIMLFASQTNETVSSQEGKEKMRLDALEEVRNIVERENKTPREDVVDLYFNNFIVQK